MQSEPLSSIWSFYSFPGIDTLIDSSSQQFLVRGCTGSGSSFLISNYFRKTAKSVLVLTENSKRAEVVCEECQSLCDEESVLYFPSRDAVPYNQKSPFGPTVESRLNVLRRLLDGEQKIIIAPYTAIQQKTLPQKELFNKIINLHTNDDIPIEKLSEWLIDSGFHREDQVTDIGSFSIRGGIVDVYPFLTEHPYRIEFWGNTIDSIRHFDIFSQKSLDHCNQALIVPIGEFCFSHEDLKHGIENMKNTFNGSDLIKGIEKLDHQWNVGEHEGIEWFFHWFDKPVSSLFDYLSTETTVFWDDIVPMPNRFTDSRANYQRHRDRNPQKLQPYLSSPDQLLFSDEYLEDSLSCFKTVYLDTAEVAGDCKTVSVSVSEQLSFSYEMDMLKNHFKGYLEKSYSCFMICPNSGHQKRMEELLSSDNLAIEYLIGLVSRGFVDHEKKIVFYSESQIVNRPQHLRKEKKRSTSIPLAGYDALSPNDFVVHEDHGIARFLGIEHISAGDLKQDCMVLQYANNTKIYVPVQDFYKVQKYIGNDAHQPSLSKIGTASWEKLKKRTRETLKEMASELIELYAKRQYLDGISVDKDTIWQKEFEESFIYNETPDQLRAVSEIKKDMEASQPMDRLVCGDVGFGKTEVAMRAAFKAVMSGYQVAILAPTTILAAQHFSTFSDRMRNFPVKIGHLSRFVKPAVVKETIQNVKDGKVDILIGTHRILSKDISFKNLGLLIIDEEQRFGVQHKEKIKQFRFKIDVLSLTATPIPRTLHLSLIGARDLSIINTPPQNRLPIETIVSPYHDDLVKQAIEDELERGGQIFFVNNRIGNLEKIKDTIELLVPKAKAVIAHGQMNEDLLEKIMKEFIAGRFDILLSTVIIENGLDISNVNTIIVNRSDTMGLSQLYQLRGRVGRSSEQAFAFFFTPPFRQISDIALKRLKALEQYTELGSGFQIAMRDLELRGAGHILGTQQHGSIEAIGFELYCRILKEAIDELKGTAVESKPSDVVIEIPLEAYIPTSYVHDGQTRVSLYQELSSLADLPSVASFEQSLTDRFGALPKQVISLLTIINIKVLSCSSGIQKIALSNAPQIIFTLTKDLNNLQDTIRKFVSVSEYSFNISNTDPVTISTSPVSLETENQSIEIFDLLKTIASK